MMRINENESYVLNHVIIFLNNVTIFYKAFISSFDMNMTLPRQKSVVQKFSIEIESIFIYHFDDNASSGNAF